MMIYFIYRKTDTILKIPICPQTDLRFNKPLSKIPIFFLMSFTNWFQIYTWNEYNPKEATKTGEIWPTRYQDYFIQLFWYIDKDRLMNGTESRAETLWSTYVWKFFKRKVKRYTFKKCIWCLVIYIFLKRD